MVMMNSGWLDRYRIYTYPCTFLRKALTPTAAVSAPTYPTVLLTTLEKKRQYTIISLKAIKAVYHRLIKLVGKALLISLFMSIFNVLNG